MHTRKRAKGCTSPAALGDAVTPTISTKWHRRESELADHFVAVIGPLQHDLNGQRHCLVLTSTEIALSKEQRTTILLDTLSAVEEVSSHTPAAYQISNRELACLKWTVVGKSSPMIALIYGLSVHMVMGHLKSALKKLGCVTRAHAVAKATRLRLI